MAVLLARYRLADPERFAREFADFGAARAALGVRGHRVLRAAGDPARATVLFELDTVEAARAYADSPERRAALERAGVTEAVDEVLEEVERAG